MANLANHSTSNNNLIGTGANLSTIAPYVEQLLVFSVVVGSGNSSPRMNRNCKGDLVGRSRNSERGIVADAPQLMILRSAWHARRNRCQNQRDIAPTTPGKMCNFGQTRSGGGFRVWVLLEPTGFNSWFFIDRRCPDSEAWRTLLLDRSQRSAFSRRTR